MPSTHEKRKLFCYFYLKLGNVQEAGIKAGFQPSIALVEGLKILENPSYQPQLQRLQTVTNLSVARLVTTGLERLAFGSINDAVTLACSDEFPPPQVLEKLDLFNISEIKRVKGGGVEIKFADRLKAMEKLLACEKESSELNNAESLINALKFDNSE